MPHSNTVSFHVFCDSHRSTRYPAYLSCSCFNKTSAVYGDGVQYMSDLLEVIRTSSAENAAALRKLQPGPGQTSGSPSSPDGDSDDSAARARRYVVTT